MIENDDWQKATFLNSLMEIGQPAAATIKGRAFVDEIRNKDVQQFDLYTGRIVSCFKANKFYTF